MPRTPSANSKILIVDDDAANLDLLYQTLASRPETILAAPSGEVAVRLALEAAPDLILLDLVMPGMDGLETCRRIKANEGTRNIPILFITAHHDTTTLVSAFRAGAVDYITKPFHAEEVLTRVETHLELSRLARELRQSNATLRAEIQRREQAEVALAQADRTVSLLSEREADRWGLGAFIGRSPQHLEMLGAIRKLQGVNTTVLITGESGTGKELVARALHFGGLRAKRPFIAVNCAAIPRDLAESELFGHVKGAFSGAISDRKGAFELAHGGTLFLDEVGDLPLPLQPKLLRVLETGAVWRLGAQRETKVDARLVAATNADLERRRGTGEFRDDLYFRLARCVVRLAPLRERIEDIPLLAEHFVRKLSVEMGRLPPPLAAATRQLLKAHTWPGNVRELRNVIERALLECGGGELQAEHVLSGGPLASAPLGLQPRSVATLSSAGQLFRTPTAIPWNLEEAELVLIRQALEQTGGNLSKAAELLGVNRGKLYRRLALIGDAAPSPSHDLPTGQP